MKLGRRDFLRLSAAAGCTAASGSLLSACYAGPAAVAPRRIGPNDKLNVLSIGVVGTIGETDRHNVAKHPMVRIAGLCDVDANYMAKAAHDHPDAFGHAHAVGGGRERFAPAILGQS